MTTKKIRNVWDMICSFENLHAAYLHARKGKRYRRDVLRFSEHLEFNLLQLQKELKSRTYSEGGYHTFYVYDPKKRLIMALPFRDRVVQWAVYQVVNLVFASGYIKDTYACVNGRGVHHAVSRIQYWVRKDLKKSTPDSENKLFYLKLDISKYYYRINHEVVLKILGKKIHDDNLMWYFDNTINSKQMPFGLPLGKSPDEVKDSDRLYEVGMPIGSLISQMIANVCLNQLDQYCKRTLSIKYYCRYMDDLVIIHPSKNQLHEWKSMIEDFLNRELKLNLNNKTALRPVSLGIDFCGYKIWNTHVKLRKSTALRMKHRLKKLEKDYAVGKEDVEKLRMVMASYRGILKHCDSHSLKKGIAESLVFKRTKETSE